MLSTRLIFGPLAGCTAVAAAYDAATQERPNIVAIVCEDIGCYLGCYGDPVAVTPHLDNFAREAVRHTRMFTSVGVSAPSRYSLITGRYPSADGANYMRANFFDKEFECIPPAGVKCFTEYLRAAGYYCTNRAKTDYQFRPPLSAWDECGREAHWKNAPDGVPFYAVFNLDMTHESTIWSRTGQPLAVDPDDVVVPPYLPDNEIVRHDMAVMYTRIAIMDARFGELYEELETAGKLANTVVLFYSDNGGPLPRGKREIMDSGTLVPFMIRLPDGRGAGGSDHSLNMFVDIPATILSLAGIAPPRNMHGRAIYGKFKGKPRRYVFGATDRFDEQVEKRASIRDGRYLYIRNYMPAQSVYRPNAYRLQMPMMRNIVRLRDAGALNEIQMQWFREPADAESLFDCRADPHNIRNLAGDPGCRRTLGKMRRAYRKEWIDRYNSRWVRFSEADFRREMWPDGVKPQVAAPSASIEGGRLVVAPPQDASVVYRVCSGEGIEGRWLLYSKPVSVRCGERIEVVACRIGCRDSEVVALSR